MKKKPTKWIILAAVIILGLLALNLFSGSGKPTYAEATAQKGSIATYYNFSGAMEVKQAVTVSASVADTVAEVYVKANAPIQKNTRILRMTDGTVFKADIAGEVTALNVSAGSVVAPGDVLAEVMDLSHMKATFQVDEYDVSAITLGKQADITLDGSGSLIQAPVTSLNKRATQNGDLSYYTATVDLAGVALPADALPGMQVTVKLLNQQVENAVLLPMDAVSFTSQNLPYVLLPDGSNVKKADIKVGINDGDMVEITSGLSEGDKVLYTPTSAEGVQMMMGRPRNYAQ
ncbi:MAG: HlyD family efflux transporter periplasmic adaptor subunit [Candidatus Limiplasma sp.]|nr:HlyD family efflux transporter periplasmic adaptor subunit [Candidatus Limiplasma sp.]MEA5145883.1 HlyD family efflux transporter periplasmic adaptor subunit [Candidatus Limiplasma sp.]